MSVEDERKDKPVMILIELSELVEMQKLARAGREPQVKYGGKQEMLEEAYVKRGGSLSEIDLRLKRLLFNVKEIQ